MERYTSLDKSRLLNFKVRIGEASVPKILTFLQNGSPYDITSKDFRVRLKKTPTAKELLWELAEGSGLTIIDTNKLRIEVSQSQSNFKAYDVFFGTLYSATEDHTWINGDWEFHNGKYDGVTETNEIYIYETGDGVTIEVTGEGSGTSLQFQNEGTDLGNNQADTVDFVGAGVTASRAGNKITVEIPGASGDLFIDGGTASSIYTGTDEIDGGGA